MKQMKVMLLMLLALTATMALAGTLQEDLTGFWVLDTEATAAKLKAYDKEKLTPSKMRSYVNGVRGAFQFDGKVLGLWHAGRKGPQMPYTATTPSDKELHLVLSSGKNKMAIKISRAEKGRINMLLMPDDKYGCLVFKKTTLVAIKEAGKAEMNKILTTKLKAKLAMLGIKIMDMYGKLPESPKTLDELVPLGLPGSTIKCPVPGASYVLHPNLKKNLHAAKSVPLVTVKGLPDGIPRFALYTGGTVKEEPAK